MHGNPSPTLTLVYLSVAVGGVLLAAVGGSEPLALILGAAIALGGGTLAIVTWRRAAPFHVAHLTGLWWRFVIAGPALLGAVIVTAGLGVEAWFLGFAVVCMAIALVSIGLVLGIARLVSRRSASLA